MGRVATAGLVAVSLALLSCGGPRHRIERAPELFASFPPQAQEKIRAGEVDVGFTPDMVRMALGPPDRRYARQTAEGSAEVWAYVDPGARGSGAGANLVFGAGGGSVYGLYGVGVGSAARQHAAEKRKVVFRNSVVVAVEDLVR